MRTITAGLFITLDGVIEAPEKWNPPYYDEELNRAVLPQLADADVHMYGRRSYDLFRAVFTGPAAPPHAAMMTSTPKVVVSTALDHPDWGSTTVISSDVIAELTKLKEQPGGIIAVAASGTLVRYLLTEGLLDEFRLLVHPVVVGTGKHLFEGGFGQVPLNLAEARPHSNGVVALRYTRRLTSDTGGTRMPGAAGARIWYQSFTDPGADSAYFTRLEEYLGSVTSPGCQVEVSGIRPGARHPHPITEFRCAAQVIANALTAEQQGYDAFVIGHFQEPGLAEARSAVRIPVTGLGEATMLHACTLGRKIGLVATNPAFIPCLEDQIARHGLHRRVIAVQAVQPEPGQFNRAFDDEGEYRSVREAFAAAAEPMPGLGIDVIIPAGGYPMLLFTREPSFTISGATVLNGLPVAVAAAETAIRLSRLNGTGTSRRTAYALPPGEAVTEFRDAFTTARSE